MEFRGEGKRGRPEAGLNGNGSYKKSKPEMDSLSTGIGSKSKPCTKVFSTWKFWILFGYICFICYCVNSYDSSFFYIIGKVLGLILELIDVNAFGFCFARNSPPAVKTRLCNNYNTDEGCKFGDKCHFAHGEWELGMPMAPSYKDPRSMGGPLPGRIGGQMELQPPPYHGLAASSFGASATAKISVDALLGGAIIGRNGVNSKQICRVTGAKLSIRDHESEPNLKNIELVGTFDQIKQASTMIHELILNIGSAAGKPMKNHSTGHLAPASNFKTKLCEKFTQGACTFGERCHFAHGAEELCKPGI
ncbi:hypothetical protein UlMin_029652 [Ulmus minor]